MKIKDNKRQISHHNKLSKTTKSIPYFNYTDYELNSLSYRKALIYDKRKYYQYYLSLLKLKHPLLFSFFPRKDYNIFIIKIDIFLLSFAINYAINALFFTEATIHQIYSDRGKYNLSYLFPQIILSFIFSYIINIMMKFIFLSERNIIKIKIQESRKKAVDIAEKVKRCLIIKHLLTFSAISTAFLRDS